MSADIVPCPDDLRPAARRELLRRLTHLWREAEACRVAAIEAGMPDTAQAIASAVTSKMPAVIGTCVIEATR